MNLEYMNVSLFEMSSIFFLLFHDIDIFLMNLYITKIIKILEDRKKVYPPFSCHKMYYLNYDPTGL